LLFATVIGLVGCSSEAKLGPVNGSVSLDGKPVTAGVVTFIAADHSNTASAEITPEGKYTIADAPTGEVVICVRTRDQEFILGPGAGPPPKDPNVAGSAGVVLNQKKNPLYVRTPERYEDAAKSDLKTVLKPGGPATYDIKMTK
jgi:hypothetical protein